MNNMLSHNTQDFGKPTTTLRIAHANNLQQASQDTMNHTYLHKHYYTDQTDQTHCTGERQEGIEFRINLSLTGLPTNTMNISN
jgi:hypothetical protein